MACFASNVDRVQQIIDAAVALGRRVSFVGRSMVRNMGIARELGFLKVADDDILDIAAAEMMPADQLVLITTGTQGEPMAALSRMSRGEHRSITLTAGDLIILSSSLIPGNEEAVFGVIDALAKIGARVVTNAQARVHVSGHAYAGELLFLYNGVRPRNVMPVHGTWRHLRANAALAVRTGVPAGERGAGRERCQRRPGRTGVASIAGAVPVGKMFVDGLITGDVGESTARRTAHAVLGLHRHHGRRAPGHRQVGRSRPPALTRVLRGPQGAGAGGRQGGGRAGTPCRRDQVTDPARIAQAVRRTVGKWVGETYRRQPMIVPTVIEID